ncbi:MAG: hypothetical protein JO332_14740 [Planctomycetaceae bacterium]|nr:hypothetical protein [Planctomycetaceae bacterium]
METTPTPEILQKGLRKVLAAIEGSGFKATAIGGIARLSWGSKLPVLGVDLLVPTGEAQRATIQGAARGEGCQTVSGAGPLSFRFSDAKLNASTPIEILEATTPFHKQVLERAKPRVFLQMQLNAASVEDLILFCAASGTPADKESMIELLRGYAGTMDAAYVKKEAQAAGSFDALKAAWAEAKARG